MCSYLKAVGIKYTRNKQGRDPSAALQDTLSEHLLVRIQPQPKLVKRTKKNRKKFFFPFSQSEIMSVWGIFPTLQNFIIKKITCRQVWKEIIAQEISSALKIQIYLYKRSKSPPGIVQHAF